MPAEAQTTDRFVRPSRADLESLVHAATLAPSPDNNQPWLFEEGTEGELLLLHDRSRALPSDVNDMFSMIALGAALENICIAARQHGWEPHVRYLIGCETNSAKREVVAGIRLAEGGSGDPLHPFLGERLTCRKPYARRPPAELVLETLASAATDATDLRVHWLTERAAIRALAPLIAATDRIRFEYPAFHRELYHQLRFTAAEAEQTRDGLDIRTLEVPPGTGLILRMLRPWKLMRFLNRLGLSRLLTLPSAVSVWRSGAIGALTVEKATPLSFLQAGRSFQRLWLTSQQQGLSLQPLGSLPIFLGQLELLEGKHLNEKHRKQLAILAKRFRELLPASRDRILVITFRLGSAGIPKVRSLRRPMPGALRFGVA